ncbi:MAG: hypothetical protein QF464_07000 [Myxococcota bacterium]|nr:hypothetical protein [Myxococcota bacterium]
MRVVFRADGGGRVGWGHLGRCAALAQVLTETGVEVAWACRAEPAVARLTGSPPALVLKGAPSMDTLPRAEAEAVGAFAKDADWVVVDHYGADDAYLAALRGETGARVMVFDDHQVRTQADLRLAPMQPEQPHTLAGAAYQPVRPCFYRVPSAPQREGWLLALGGADPHDDTSTCVRALDGGQPLCVVASDALATRQALDEAIAARRVDARRHAWLAPKALAECLAGCEAALVSASTLCWEALATGTPIVALQTANNQAGVVETLRQAGVPVFTDAGEASNALRLGLAARATSDARLDGLGAWRVAQAMGVQVDLPSGASPCERSEG